MDQKRLAVIQPPVSFRAKDGTEFSFLPGAHSPGSMMLLITTSRGDQLLYPGDYCMANRYYQEDPEALAKLLNARGKRWLLIDGTFLAHGPSDDDTDLEKSLLELINNDWASKKEVIFVAESIDYLYSAYIWYFQTYYTGEKSTIDRHLVATPGLIKLLESTFEPFIRRRHECYDPYLRAVLKAANPQSG